MTLEEKKTQFRLLLEEGVSIAEISLKTGISSNDLYQWEKELERGGKTDRKSPMRAKATTIEDISVAKDIIEVLKYAIPGIICMILILKFVAN